MEFMCATDKRQKICHQLETASVQPIVTRVFDHGVGELHDLRFIAAVKVRDTVEEGGDTVEGVVAILHGNNHGHPIFGVLSFEAEQWMLTSDGTESWRQSKGNSADSIRTLM